MNLYSSINKTLNESVLSKDTPDFSKKVIQEFIDYIEYKYNIEDSGELSQQLTKVTEDDVNDFFTSKFYDIWDEEDLESANAAEEIIRRKYLHYEDPSESGKNWYIIQLTDDKGTHGICNEDADTPEEAVKKFLELNPSFNEKGKIEAKFDHQIHETEEYDNSLFIDIDELVKYAEQYLIKEVGTCTINKRPDGQFMLNIKGDDATYDRWLRLHGIEDDSSDDYEYDDGDTNWAAEEASDADERLERRYGGIDDSEQNDPKVGIRKKQLINNIEDIVYSYYNGIEGGDYEPFNNDDELVNYVYKDVFDLKSDGYGTTRYGIGICQDLKYLGKEYIINEIKRIGHEAEVVKED